ncbi:hypothetical protein [Nakamurella lactea]|uniref:hypothetical protein n=1 Tax=Nakamurella lactea TaxID=459515 RepID=UPI00048D2E30|nr:hypothetical protein [Nakamurella lactea]
MIPRIIAGVLIAAAAAAIWITMWPSAGAGTAKSNLAAIQSADQVNQLTTNGAAQQAVVNGWTTRDLLVAMAEEEKAGSDRTTALLGIGVIGIALAIMLPAGRRTERILAPTAQEVEVPQSPWSPSNTAGGAAPS